MLLDQLSFTDGRSAGGFRRAVTGSGGDAVYPAGTARWLRRGRRHLASRHTR
jgi:hypothetical protein